MTYRRFVVPDPTKSPTEYPVSALVAEQHGGHDRVKVWSRGGLAGEIVLDHGDIAHVAAALGLAEADS